MKSLLASLLVVAVWPLVLAGGQADVTPTQESLIKIKQEFPYDPVAKHEKTAVREPADPAVMMERLTVVGSFQYRQLQQKIEHDTRQKKAELFSLARGGLLLRKGRLELGSWEHPGGGLTFLRFLW